MGENSFSPELKLSENNEFYQMERKNDTNSEITQSEQKIIQEQNKQVEEYNKKAQEEVKKYTQYCYFFNKNGELTEIKRELNSKPTLESVITALLKGPMISETKNGIYSEIPPNVDLISVKKTNSTIIINLSSNFGNGGGSQSVENRVKQLNKTIKRYHPDKSVYLHINGKEVEYLGGEGIYIKQPLE